MLLLGTAHVSSKSERDTRRVIEAARPQNVVVELCRCASRRFAGCLPRCCVMARISQLASVTEAPYCALQSRTDMSSSTALAQIRRRPQTCDVCSHG